MSAYTETAQSIQNGSEQIAEQRGYEIFSTLSLLACGRLPAIMLRYRPFHSVDLHLHLLYVK